MVDAMERVSGCGPGDPDVLPGSRQVTPARKCLQRDGGYAFVRMVAGSGGPQAVRMDTSREGCLVGGFPNTSVDGRPGSWKAPVAIRKPLDAESDSQR
jgi:hypothetical protein